MNTNLFHIDRDNSSMSNTQQNNNNNFDTEEDKEDKEQMRQELQIKRDTRNTSEKFRDHDLPDLNSLDSLGNESDTTDNTSRKMSTDSAHSFDQAPLQLPSPIPTENERNTLQVMSGSIMSLLNQIVNPTRQPSLPRPEPIESQIPRRNPLLSLFTSLPLFHHNSNDLRSISDNSGTQNPESNLSNHQQVNQSQEDPENDIMDQGAIIVRTVHPGPNGLMIVRMRVIPFNEIFGRHNHGGNPLFEGPDSIHSGLFGALFRLLATVSDFHVERGLDKDTLDSLPVVKYTTESFKNVDEGSKRCAICFDHYEDEQEVRYLWCLHRFHKGCVDQWLDNHSNCPICKKDYSDCEKDNFE